MNVLPPDVMLCPVCAEKLVEMDVDCFRMNAWIRVQWACPNCLCCVKWEGPHAPEKD